MFIYDNLQKVSTIPVTHMHIHILLAFFYGCEIIFKYTHFMKPIIINSYQGGAHVGKKRYLREKILYVVVKCACPLQKND